MVSVLLAWVEHLQFFRFLWTFPSFVEKQLDSE